MSHSVQSDRNPKLSKIHFMNLFCAPEMPRLVQSLVRRIVTCIVILPREAVTPFYILLLSPSLFSRTYSVFLAFTSLFNFLHFACFLTRLFSEWIYNLNAASFILFRSFQLLCPWYLLNFRCFLKYILWSRIQVPDVPIM